MIYLERCKRILADTRVSDDQFLQVHFYLEGLIRRMLFIGLRLKNIQYDTAQAMVSRYKNDNLAGLLKDAWAKIGVKESGLLEQDNYRELRDLVIGFTAPARNLRVHGIRDQYDDKELLALLIRTDTLFIQEVNRILLEKKGATLFDPPRKFGAVIVREKKDLVRRETAARTNPEKRDILSFINRIQFPMVAGDKKGAPAFGQRNADCICKGHRIQRFEPGRLINFHPGNIIDNNDRRSESKLQKLLRFAAVRQAQPVIINFNKVYRRHENFCFGTQSRLGKQVAYFIPPLFLIQKSDQCTGIQNIDHFRHCVRSMIRRSSIRRSSSFSAWWRSRYEPGASTPSYRPQSASTAASMEACVLGGSDSCGYVKTTCAGPTGTVSGTVNRTSRLAGISTVCSIRLIPSTIAPMSRFVNRRRKNKTPGPFLIYQRPKGHLPIEAGK